MDYHYKVIAFGSSAGGIDPLRHILGELPADINASLLVVQHLSSHYPSKLPEILQRSTTLPIIKVTEDMPMEKGKVYVISEGQVMTLSDGNLVVRERSEEEKKVNKTIDQLFFSLAEEVGSQTIGVILSGAGGFDGIEGAKAVEEEQGIIIVQEPYTAQHPGMPKSLIANDHPDYVLTPDEIAEKIVEHCRA
jgi:two-component system, chemotaxis family, protein-glutamate methylesterase/glutaminase